MERRRVLALAASGLTGSLAGCTSMSSTVSDLVEERSQHSESTEVNANISTSGPAILITPTETLPRKAVLYQNGSEVTSVEMSGINRGAYREIINYERAKNPEQRLFEPGTIKIVFIDSDGKEMETVEWEFQPHPVVENFTIATTTEYDPSGSLSETTPVFQVRNLGSGPTCLSELEITNPRTTVTVSEGGGRVESPMLQTGTYGLDDPEITVHETPHRMTGLLPVERDYFVAFNDLFTVSVPNADLEATTPPERINQTFDVVLHTVYGESYTTTIDVAMVGGVVRSQSEEASWTHRYQTIRLESVSYESP